MKKITISIILVLGFIVVMSFANTQNTYVDVSFWNIQQDRASMGDYAFKYNRKALYKPEDNTLTIGINPVDLSGYKSALTDFKYDKDANGVFSDATVLATGTVHTGTLNDGSDHEIVYISKVSFTLPSNLKKKGIEYIDVKIKVPHTPMDNVVTDGLLSTKLRLNWDKAIITQDEYLNANTRIAKQEDDILNKEIAQEATTTELIAQETIVKESLTQIADVKEVMSTEFAVEKTTINEVTTTENETDENITEETVIDEGETKNTELEEIITIEDAAKSTAEESTTEAIPLVEDAFKDIKLSAESKKVEVKTHYLNPDTKEIDDQGAKNAAIGEGMTRSVIYEFGQLEKQKDKYSLYIKVKLYSNIENLNIKVQANKGDANSYIPVSFDKVYDKKDDNSAIYKIDIPRADANMQFKAYIKPMQRDVIFYVNAEQEGLEEFEAKIIDKHVNDSKFFLTLIMWPLLNLMHLIFI